jgi:hypothetical protein
MLFDIWSINSEGKLGNAIAFVLERGGIENAKERRPSLVYQLYNMRGTDWLGPCLGLRISDVGPVMFYSGDHSLLRYVGRIAPICNTEI